MRLSMILGVSLALAASASFAQQPQTYRPKKYSHGEGKNSAKPVPLPKTRSAVADSSKDLQRIEHETAKAAKPAGPKRAPGSAALFKPDKPRPMPPINASAHGGTGTSTKGLGTNNQGKNPYRGRLRQKGSH